MERVDVTIIGAGAVGLACAYALKDSGMDVLVVERHATFGEETSSRNSEVIHSGIYYPRGSLKATTCIRGKELLYDLAAKAGIGHKRLGKILVANNDLEEEKLKTIYDNARDCGVTDLRYLEAGELKKIEPDIRARVSLYCPGTGIIDTHGFMKHMFAVSRSKGVEFAYSVEVDGIRKKRGLYEIGVREPGGEKYSFESEAVINCAGLSSDRIAGMAGIDTAGAGYRIHMCKGQYFRISKPGKFRIIHLVYPPPTDISLGIHITPDMGEGLRLGPDAEYVSETDYAVSENDRGKFFESVRTLLPSLSEDDLMPDTAGIRPKLHGKEAKFADFIIREESDRGLPRLVNTVGIESPGLTASLAIGEMVSGMIK
ncbi:MAG: NAD(P)/FAD-dependent oxidoreductase [Candidatus Omnitrophota bacterium]